MIAEVIGGLLTTSLALLADAGHMLSDVAALALSFVAIWLAERPATSRRTYGYYRSEILAALVNGAALLAVSVFIFVEAYRRFWQPPEVLGPLMFWIALGGLVVNGLSLKILHAGHHENLNLRGAWLHVLTDTLGSVGAIAAAVLIWTLGWNWVDPMVSVLIGLLIIYSAWRLVAEAVSVLMEAAPRGIDVDRVREAMLETPGVCSIHDLHVWTITSGLDSLSAHVVAEPEQPPGAVIRRLREVLEGGFGIPHITIQVEPPDFEHCEPPV